MLFDRSKRPSESGEIKFIAPDIQKVVLNNGLEVLLCEKKELPMIRINFLVNSGSKLDPIESKGLCNLLSMCIDEGAGEFNALQLADKFEMLGAHFSAACNADFSVLSLQVLSENFIPALKLLTTVITQPHFEESDFKREKNKVLVRLNQSKTEPDYIADIAFEYFLFGKSSPYAYPVSGIEGTVQNIDADKIRNVYKNNFNPTSSTVVVVGNIDMDSSQKELMSGFEQWENKIIKNISFVNTSIGSQQKVFVINKANAVQTEIRMGHLTSKRNEIDYFQKQVVNLILGGQFSSRLNSNLREKNGYTYGVHSRFNYLKDAGFFAVSTSVDGANTVNALREIQKELNKIKDGITIEELVFAKSSLIKKFPSNFETYKQIAINISTKVIHNLTDNYFNTYVENLKTLDLVNVNKIASGSIYPDKLVTVLVGDSTKILSELNENEFGQISVLEIDDLFH